MKTKNIFKSFLLFTGMIMSLGAYSQMFTNKNAHVWFYSDASLEKIEAHNKQVSAVINSTNGEVAFKVIMKSFEFEKALMQEHFNENYVESDKYPNATFKGKITNIEAVDFKKDGKYNTNIEGDLTIHGVTKKIKESGNIEIKGETAHVKCTYYINLKDYNIELPSAVFNKVSEKIQINVDALLTKK